MWESWSKKPVSEWGPYEISWLNFLKTKATVLIEPRQQIYINQQKQNGSLYSSVL